MRDAVMCRYWIDLRRNGHVVRMETYSKEGMMSRLDITLDEFPLKGAAVWMPVAGETSTYAATRNGKPTISKEPITISTIRVVKGTMEFNKHPGREAFLARYKPGTPVSDGLRRLRYEFGQQKVDARMTKGQAEASLKEQIEKAEEQKSELVAASPARDFDWQPWLVAGLAVLALGALLALWNQRRR